MSEAESSSLGRRPEQVRGKVASCDVVMLGWNRAGKHNKFGVAKFVWLFFIEHHWAQMCLSYHKRALDVRERFGLAQFHHSAAESMMCNVG